MAEDKVEFELVSPEHLVVSERVEMVVVPGTEGDFGVLPRHTPLVSTVRPGVVRIFEGAAARDSIFVEGGFAEVTPARCTVLTPRAMPVGEIDGAQAEQRLKDAHEDLADAKTDAERAAAAHAIAVCEAMIAVVRERA